MRLAIAYVNRYNGAELNLSVHPVGMDCDFDALLENSFYYGQSSADNRAI